MTTYYYGNNNSDNILIQMVGDHEIPMLSNEVDIIKELTGADDFRLLAIKVDDWNLELSPWQAPAVFGKEDFGGHGSDSLNKVLEIIDNEILNEFDRSKLHIYIGGYSLSGLFALWSVYQTDMFDGVAAASPSVWYPGFDEYTYDNNIKTSAVYMSLGDKESKTRNPIMAQVSDKIQEIYKFLDAKIDVKFEWNEGNHFKEPDLRIAKAFAWLLRR